MYPVLLRHISDAVYCIFPTRKLTINFTVIHTDKQYNSLPHFKRVLIDTSLLYLQCSEELTAPAQIGTASKLLLLERSTALTRVEET